MSPSSEPEEKVEIAVFCKTAGSLLPPSSSPVTLTLTAPGPCRLPLAVAICGFSFPKLLQRHRNSVAAFPKLLPTQTESWFSAQQSCGATRELFRRRGGTDPGRCFPVQLEYQSLQTSLSPEKSLNQTQLTGDQISSRMCINIFPLAAYKAVILIRY